MGARFPVCRAALIGLAVAASYPASAQVGSAGRVDFASGNVTAVTVSGEKRALSKGAEIKAGETVDTGAGRAQLRFSDGARVSLLPQTRFKVEEYRFSGTPDGTERGIFELISGGMRTITGLIGRTNRDNYQVRTNVATIGIRGTEYNIQYVNSIAGGVGQGRIAVCNNAGCSEFGANESFIVTDINTLPQQTFKKMELEDRGPQRQDLGGYVAGEASLAGVSGTIGGIEVGGGGGGGAGPGPSAYVVASGIAVENSPGSPMVPFAVAESGTVTCASAGNCSVLDLPSGKLLQNSTSVIEQGGDSIVAWGRWKDGKYNNTNPAYKNTDLTDQQGLHYVYGTPTPVLPATGSFGYSLLGATKATSLDGTLGLGAFSGTLAGGNVLAVNFASGKMDLGFQVAFAGPTYQVQGTNLSVASQFTYNGGQLTTPGCGGCTASVNGFFAGPVAERAGLGYQINTGTNSVSGVAALTKN